MKRPALVVVLSVLLLASGCASSTPPPGSTVYTYIPKVGNASVRFETTEANRAQARASGQPVLLSGYATHFPEQAREQGLRNGWVQLQADIDEQGRVSNAKVVESSDPIFEVEAVKALLSWQFEARQAPTQIYQRLFFHSGQPAPDRTQDIQ